MLLRGQTLPLNLTRIEVQYDESDPAIAQRWPGPIIHSTGRLYIMALHGELRVNDHIIGAWSARRTTHVVGSYGADLAYSYDVQVYWTDINGVPKQVSFALVHKYDEGALTLAGKVLTQAARMTPFYDETIA